MRILVGGAGIGGLSFAVACRERGLAAQVVERLPRLEPVGAGLVLFNLKERRIIQVQNSYAAVKRQDRGRIHEGGEPTTRLYHYKLPADWQLLP